jgi:hypothetical protein
MGILYIELIPYSLKKSIKKEKNLSGEATIANFIVFEPTIYRTPVDHANHYTTDAVVK